MVSQPSRIKNNKPTKKKSPTVGSVKKWKRTHKQQYGTSKLEEYFAKEFLDRLGVEYIYQFEAKDIGRFYDFYLPNSRILIEVDGDYYHSNPEKYSKDELNAMQKHNQRVDEYKNKWALMRGIPLLRIWENDIRNNPEKVMLVLQHLIGEQNRKIMLENGKKKRH